VTTPSFLVHFGLDSLNELPGLDELRAAGLLDLTPLTLPEQAGGESAEREAGAEP
jgi:segregation and condensation protein B